MLTILGCETESGADDDGGNPCDECVGTPLGPDNTNPAVSCTATGEPNECTCLDEMGESYSAFLSPGGCI
ncbi:MAG: hypothetical protein AMJ62_02060 [Myxococcales bacterium SG8_38]|nr:MAG: hypothetical protein AMJ62_02060 [Myxococcales bacterium SG8_38]